MILTGQLIVSGITYKKKKNVCERNLSGLKSILYVGKWHSAYTSTRALKYILLVNIHMI